MIGSAPSPIAEHRTDATGREFGGSGRDDPYLRVGCLSSSNRGICQRGGFRSAKATDHSQPLSEGAVNTLIQQGVTRSGLPGAFRAHSLCARFRAVAQVISGLSPAGGIGQLDGGDSTSRASSPSTVALLYQTLVRIPLGTCSWSRPPSGAYCRRVHSRRWR